MYDLATIMRIFQLNIGFSRFNFAPKLPFRLTCSCFQCIAKDEIIFVTELYAATYLCTLKDKKIMIVCLVKHKEDKYRFNFR
jgi:uncharacterized protein YegP (UPF0339 family)